MDQSNGHRLYSWLIDCMGSMTFVELKYSRAQLIDIHHQSVDVFFMKIEIQTQPIDWLMHFCFIS